MPPMLFVANNSFVRSACRASLCAALFSIIAAPVTADPGVAWAAATPAATTERSIVAAERPIAATERTIAAAERPIAAAERSITAAERSIAAAAPLPAQAPVQIQAPASEAPQGETIRAIRVEGNQTYEDDTVLFFMVSRVGETFDWVTARADFRTMLNSDFFDDLQMTWENVEGGVDLIITVQERPVLRDIHIQGTEKEDKDGLLERMELLEMPVGIDQPVDRQLMQRVGDVLTTMLQGDEGLQFVQVNFALREAVSGSGVDAVYDVVEGDTVRIENVYFEGATEFTQKELRWLAKKTGEHWLFSFLTKNDRFSPSGWEFDNLNISNEYRRIGYLGIAFGEPEVEVHEVDRAFPLGPVRRLYVRIPIEEGTQFRLGQVHIEGNTRISDENLTSLVPIAPGELFDVKGVVDAQTAMENIYSNIGYFQVQITPDTDETSEPGIMDLRYIINENALYAVRRIEFEGNTNTRDYVMRRNLRINENDLWSQAAVEASKFKIQQLGYFDNIEEEVIIVRDPEAPQPLAGEEFDPNASQPREAQFGEVDLKLKVSEVGRNQISFGGGVSALEGAFVQLGYATRNLFGRGQTFSFNGQFGKRTTSARVSFAQPFLLDKNIRFGFDTFSTSLDFIDFQQRSNGISTRLGFPLDRGQFTTLFLEYNYAFIDVSNVNDSFNNLSGPLFNSLFLLEGNRTTSSFRPNLLYNSVNNPFNPSRGRRHTASFEVAGGPLGGSLDFWKGLLGTTWYIPTKVDGLGVNASVSQIFAFNIDLRIVEGFDELSIVPIFERFFLGGSTSVRGTQLRAISPLDQFGNIIGGTRALQYNVEYIFQLANPVRVAAFHDAGASWSGDYAPTLEDLRKTAGVEFRVFMPVFNVPFRFFWAYNFDPLPQFGEERSSFEFAVGATF